LYSQITLRCLFGNIHIEAIIALVVIEIAILVESMVKSPSMENPFKKGRPSNPQQQVAGLSEEIAGWTEILADEPMSEATRKSMTARVKALGERREQLRVNLAPPTQ
jgi:hypothetical protein